MAALTTWIEMTGRTKYKMHAVCVPQKQRSTEQRSGEARVGCQGENWASKQASGNAVKDNSEKNKPRR